jgi:hypothetical protein
MTPEELAEELRNCGLDAFQHPHNRSGDAWNDYRVKIANELLKKLTIQRKV